MTDEQLRHIAQAMANELAIQDGKDAAAILPDDLTWPWIDQANVDFGRLVTAAVAAIEAAGMVVIKRSDCEDMIESIEAWAAYAGDYFRDKHGLEEELATYRAMIAVKK